MLLLTQVIKVIVRLFIDRFMKNICLWSCESISNKSYTHKNMTYMLGKKKKKKQYTQYCLKCLGEGMVTKRNRQHPQLPRQLVANKDGHLGCPSIEYEPIFLCPHSTLPSTLQYGRYKNVIQTKDWLDWKRNTQYSNNTKYYNM